MIRINLVRYGRRKKMKTFWVRVFYYFSFLIFIILLSLSFSSLIDRITGNFENELIMKRKTLARTLKQVKEGSSFKKLFSKKTEKLKEIDTLKKINQGCIDLIRYVAEASALSNVRLSSFSISSEIVEIEGFSFNTSEIAEFLKMLKNNDMVKTAGLKVVDKNSPDGYPKMRFLVICTRRSSKNI